MLEGLFAKILIITTAVVGGFNIPITKFVDVELPSNTNRADVIVETKVTDDDTEVKLAPLNTEEGVKVADDYTTYTQKVELEENQTTIVAPMVSEPEIITAPPEYFEPVDSELDLIKKELAELKKYKEEQEAAELAQEEKKHEEIIKKLNTLEGFRYNQDLSAEELETLFDKELEHRAQLEREKTEREAKRLEREAEEKEKERLEQREKEQDMVRRGLWYRDCVSGNIVKSSPPYKGYRQGC